MRSPLTPLPKGLSVLTLLPTCSHAHSLPVAGAVSRAQNRCWPCTRIRLESVAISLGPVPSLTKPPCGGSRASWLLGGLASSPAWAQLASDRYMGCAAAAATATAATAAATATAATAATAAATATAATAAATVAAHLTAPGAQGTALPATTPRLAPRTPPRTRSSRAS